MKFDPRREKLARIASIVAALRPQRKLLRVIIDDGEEAEAKQEAALAEHVARYPEDAGREVAGFDWITRVVLPDPRRAERDCR
jgi:hypothetical protein